MTTTKLTAAAVLMLLAGTALAAAPAEKCRSDKNKEAGKYVTCRQKAAAKYALTGSVDAHARTLAKCEDTFDQKWPAIEQKGGGACPDAVDAYAVRDFLDITSTDVATALAGEALPGDGHRLTTGQTQCWNSSSSAPIACAGTRQDGELQRGLGHRYVDNADGTITDARTGLTWEKLSDDGSIHDRDWEYTWGEAFASKVAGLNAIAFAGHIDWRVPNVNELQTLANYGAYAGAVWPAFNLGCTAGCTVLTCSCSWRVGYSSGFYWTSTSVTYAPQYAWILMSHDGAVDGQAKSAYRHVRAVCGGS